MKILVDCANGACYQVAPRVFHELGADVIAVASRPDGLNINHHCGATHPEALVREVNLHGADVGISLDGDGDRLVMADASGRVYHGDEILFIIALHRQSTGTLNGGVVGTLMSNFALECAFSERAVPFARASVGDRYVVEKLRKVGWQLGGENSGHIVCLDKHTTGDGIVSALQVLHALRSSGKTLDRLTQDLNLYPQILVNVQVDRGHDPCAQPHVRSAVDAAETLLNGRGRVLLRPSGTESVIRVMVEGESHALIRQLAKSIAGSIQTA